MVGLGESIDCDNSRGNDSSHGDKQGNKKNISSDQDRKPRRTCMEDDDSGDAYEDSLDNDQVRGKILGRTHMEDYGTIFGDHLNGLEENGDDGDEEADFFLTYMDVSDGECKATNSQIWTLKDIPWAIT
jgi:hypothetical protein